MSNGIQDVLGGPSKAKPKRKEETKKKSENIQITFSHDKSTKVLLDELVWLKQYVIDMEGVSQGDIIRQSLELMATKIGYEKLRKKYAEKLDKHKPKVGRKSKG